MDTIRNNKYTKPAELALKEARKLAEKYHAQSVGTEHILLGLLSRSEGTAAVVLKDCGVTEESLSDLVEKLIGEGSAETTEKDSYTPRAVAALKASGVQAKYFYSSDIGTEHILLALMRDIDCNAAKLLHTLHVDFQEMYQRILDIIGVPDDMAADYLSNVLQTAQGQTGATPTLDQYSRDLTEDVRSGKIDPVVGREEETERICRILCRKTKNNPCLIGEPGVGKTAIVEGLAQRIVRGDVPDPLKGKRLVMLDIAGMVAGAKFRGDFEERIKGAMQEAADSSDVLLFIDEIHTIIGAGSSEGALDAANIMKPMLSRGEIQVIGATTVDEYRKHIEKDAALERRFQSILVEEPTPEQCVRILEGIRPAYEKHHEVKISDEAIEACVKLSRRYVTDRFLPDKAIDLMDEACSRRQLQSYYQKNGQPEKETGDLAGLRRELEAALSAGDLEKAREVHAGIETLEKKAARHSQGAGGRARTVTAEDIAVTVSEWTKIPVTRLTESESRKLVGLEKTLHKRIIGQNEAVEAVSRAIRRGRAGLRDPKRPVGSFLFLGPTGVGKTELSKALAEAVFGSEKNIIRVDMSEYMEKFDVSKMIGSPPGYVGYDEGGQLSEQVRRHPYSVVLFDEIEKAHPDIFNVLLQVLDEGNFTDAQGRKVDFRNTVIIMTSNAGAQQIISPKKLGFGSGNDEKADYEAMKSSVMGEVNRIFRPEFLNRIDDIIVFHPLRKPEIRQIADLIIDRLAGRAKSQTGIILKVKPAVRDYIAQKGFDPKFGARPLKRAVQSEIEDALSEEILQGGVKKGKTIFCDYQDGKVTFRQAPDREKSRKTRKSEQSVKADQADKAEQTDQETE